jgi:hypothetical protein
MNAVNSTELTTVKVFPLNSSDVILGRGHAISFRAGNVAFRHIVWSLRVEYQMARRKGKQAIGRRVVGEIHELGGRFLELDTETGHYHQATDTKALEKACQALREKKMEMPADFDHHAMKAKKKWFLAIHNKKLVAQGRLLALEGNSLVTIPPNGTVEHTRSIDENQEATLYKMIQKETPTASRSFNISDIIPKRVIETTPAVFRSDPFFLGHTCTVSKDSFLQLTNADVTKTTWNRIHVSHSNFEAPYVKYITTKGCEMNSFLPSTQPALDQEKKKDHATKTFNGDTTSSLIPPHLNVFCRGLHLSSNEMNTKDEEEWSKLVAQATCDFRDSDVLGNDEELSVFNPVMWDEKEGEWAEKVTPADSGAEDMTAYVNTQPWQLANEVNFMESVIMNSESSFHH